MAGSTSAVESRTQSEAPMLLLKCLGGGEKDRTEEFTHLGMGYKTVVEQRSLKLVHSVAK